MQFPLRELVIQNVNMQDEIKELKKKQLELTKSLNDLKLNHESVLSKISASESALSDLQREENEKKAVIFAVTSELKSLEAKMLERKKSSDDIEGGISELSSKYSQTKKEIESSISELRASFNAEKSELDLVISKSKSVLSDIVNSAKILVESIQTKLNG